ncbi:MAG: DNA repair protein RecO [Cellulomonadaceae bacterium]|jgi:DNA repair protein RecO (recombination protein O)|nr:DNA repair protein RecO [Cellulomonadaceae bacterium]
MPTYRDDALVLRTHKLGEADRIVTVLTRSRGKKRVVAKGVRRTSSRFGARLEPFMSVDLQCYEGRNLDTVTQVETVGPYARAICDDYARYTAATAMCEVADRLTQDDEPALQQYWLLAGGLRSLAQGDHAPGLTLDAYLVRAFAVAGWAVSITECARCAAPGPHQAFSVATGGAVCAACRPPGSPSPAPETFTLLAALLTGDWATADASADRHRCEATSLIAAYTQYHLERTLRSLKHVDRTTPEA